MLKENDFQCNEEILISAGQTSHDLQHGGGRFTTKKGDPVVWGDIIILRIGKQNSFFRNNNSFGTFEIKNSGG